MRKYVKLLFIALIRAKSRAYARLRSARACGRSGAVAPKASP